MKNLNEEKNHIENLVNTRFNFFMMILVAIIAALFAIKNIYQLMFVLIFGSIVETSLFLVTARAQTKLDFYLNEIRKDTDEAESHANTYANSKKNFLINRSRNRIVGYYLPMIIVLTLIVSSFFPKLIYENVFYDEKSNQLYECINGSDNLQKTTENMYLRKDSISLDIKNIGEREKK